MNEETNIIRWWSCLFGHTWTMWSIVKVNIRPEGFSADRNERKCTKCGLVELKKIA